jgi:hypothetical protein
MFMLRAFLSENPDSFPLVRSGPGFASAAAYAQAVRQAAGAKPGEGAPENLP